MGFPVGLLTALPCFCPHIFSISPLPLIFLSSFLSHKYVHSLFISCPVSLLSSWSLAPTKLLSLALYIPVTFLCLSQHHQGKHREGTLSFNPYVLCCTLPYFYRRREMHVTDIKKVSLPVKGFYAIA